MELNTTIEGTEATIVISGKLTVATAPDFEAALKGLPENVTNIDVDMTDLDYVASAGLRVIVTGEKMADRRGGALRLLHPTEDVMEVLDMTGLVDVITVVQ